MLVYFIHFSEKTVIILMNNKKVEIFPVQAWINRAVSRSLRLP